MNAPSVVLYGRTMKQMSGPINKPVIAYVQDIAIENNKFPHSAIRIDWWFEVVTDPEGNQWRVAWLMDTRSFGELEGGWVWGVWWEPFDARHTHYDPYGPPRQVPGRLVDCDNVKAHDAHDSERWADYAYYPRLERSESTGLPGHMERELIDAYTERRVDDLVYAITDVTPDEEYTYRVRITNRTSLDNPVWHTEEWGMYSDGEWHGIPVNPHPPHEHLPAFCPNCGY